MTNSDIPSASVPNANAIKLFFIRLLYYTYTLSHAAPLSALPLTQPHAGPCLYDHRLRGSPTV